MSTESTDRSDAGPIYGVPLLELLPLGKSAMQQALPSRDDLLGIRSYRQGERVVAGYEVLLWHYRRSLGMINTLADELAKYEGSTVPQVIQRAEAQADA